MIALSDKWIDRLIEQPESGMGYHIVTIILKDGRRYEQVVIDSGYVTRIKGEKDIPFKEEDISDIIVTHDKWDFSKE